MDAEFGIDPNEGGTQFRLSIFGEDEPHERMEVDELNGEDLVRISFLVATRYPGCHYIHISFLKRIMLLM